MKTEWAKQNIKSRLLYKINDGKSHISYYNVVAIAGSTAAAIARYVFLQSSQSINPIEIIKRNVVPMVPN